LRRKSAAPKSGPIWCGRESARTAQCWSGWLVRLRAQRERIGLLLAAKPKGDVPAALAGLLAAVCLGHGDAAVQLEDWLETTGHPMAARVEKISADDPAALCAALMGG
jgi:hypothetical protein